MTLKKYQRMIDCLIVLAFICAWMHDKTIGWPQHVADAVAAACAGAAMTLWWKNRKFLESCDREENNE